MSDGFDKGWQGYTDALARKVELGTLQLIEDLDELPEEASQLRRELVVVGDGELAFCIESVSGH